MYILGDRDSRVPPGVGPRTPAAPPPVVDVAPEIPVAVAVFPAPSLLARCLESEPELIAPPLELRLMACDVLRTCGESCCRRCGEGVLVAPPALVELEENLFSNERR